MLMMRLQRVGRKNDPSYRIVVTDKRTGVKSDKHVDRIGSYNPKSKNFIIDADKAREWISNGVQPSDTMHNLLVSKKVIEGKKINVLPRKSPIVDEEAVKKAEEEAAAKAEAEAKAKEEAAAPVDESPTEEVSEEVKEESSEESAEEKAAEETPAAEEEEK
ncbi:MAG: 30S ribosomal protein S16 [Candidatus Pacebacteria bacterium]|nr:30S ribosomal protein S16 [Candidatus Paceibacterota bacterium]